MAKLKDVKPIKERVTTIGDGGTRNWVYPADFTGIWLKRRQVTAFVLTIVYFALPWFDVGGHQSVLVDLPNRKLAFFGLVLWPQDTLVFWFLMVGLGLFIFMVTAWFGRAWCGWACPQTVWLEHIFRPIENWIEGNALQRKKLDAQPWNANKVFKKSAKYFLFALVSSHVANTFLCYFAGTDVVIEMTFQNPANNPGWFSFMLLVNVVFFLDFAWFREQFCLIACPYGRFQSVLLDDHSIIVGYDQHRGEPRKRLAKEQGVPAGDCVECNRCVVVCPTGIDIRHGLQMECIQCTACIDACDEIMEKVGKPKGLIRYASINSLEGKTTKIIRPRPLIYLTLILILWTTGGVLLAKRDPLRLQFLRPQGIGFTVDQGVVTNQFTIKAINKGDQQIILTINVPEDVKLTSPYNPWVIPASSNAKAPVFLAKEAKHFDSSGRETIPITFVEEGQPDRIVNVVLLGGQQ
jgi:cytochrome c oxidase accessory protein FixG